MTQSSVHTTAAAINAAAPITAYRPVILRAPERGDDLELRVTAPAGGRHLPIVVFSHGFGWSMDGYGPLTDFWASQGFAVLQPTHLDSIALGLTPDDPRTPHIWRTRIADLAQIIDELARIEALVPGLAGRLDRERILVAGHSYGATSASALLGARVRNAAGEPGEDMSDPRVLAGVLLAVAGTGGDDLTPFAAEHFPFMNPTFADMTTPSLIVAGDHDQSPLSHRGPDWWTDAYTLGPGAERLLTLLGAEHALGGIPAYSGMPASPAEGPALLGLVQQATAAYLRHALDADDGGLNHLTEALELDPDAIGRIASK